MGNSVYGFEHGDKVLLTVEGTVNSAHGTWVTLELPGQTTFDAAKFTSVKIVEKAAKKPEHWPPQLGDVWRVNRSDWHVVNNDSPYPSTTTPSASLIMCPRSGVVMDFADFVKSFSYAKLVYRAGNDGAY